LTPGQRKIALMPLRPETAMDTAVPTTPNLPLQTAGASPYVWKAADTEERAAHGLPAQAMDGGPQVSQPAGDIDALPVVEETARAATVRRVAAGAVGLGLVAAAAMALRGKRKAKVAEPAD
jgi:hypothetical protein